MALDTLQVRTLVGGPETCMTVNGTLDMAAVEHVTSLYYSPEFGLFVGTSIRGDAEGTGGSAVVQLIH